MRFRPKNFLTLCIAACLAGCIPATQPPVSSPRQPQAYVQSLTVAAEVTKLRQQMSMEVPGEIGYGTAADEGWIERTKMTLAASPYKIDSPQLILAVDRNPSVQQLRVILADPAGPWQVIGGGKVSTGRRGRFGYFITPVGVFPHTAAILDYRALGTYNENHIRGLGTKGRRVWDFGWQRAQEGWLANGQRGEIRLLVHATDPTYLEPRLGRPDSKGCVRVSAAMNVFLDRHAVLDADYLRAAKSDPRIAAILPQDGDPSPLAGMYLVVFDSSWPPP